MLFRALTPHRYIVKLSLLLWCLCIFFACNGLSTLGSGGTDFPNTRTVAGRILNEDKTFAAKTEVRLYAENFIPFGFSGGKCIAVDSTDSSGCFALSFSDSGRAYNLEAVHLQKRTRLFIQNVMPDRDTLHIDDRRLSAAGALLVSIPDSLDSIPGYLYLRGTSYSVVKNPFVRNVFFDSLPAGVVPPLWFIGSDAMLQNLIIGDCGMVVSSETTFAITKAWKYRLQVFFNTTSTGVSVFEPIVHFPLALRFSALSILSLASFRNDGSDLVITQPDGKQLPFEIEKWDPVHSDALVWVKIDTIFANNNSQFINLYWGGPSVIGRPSKARVFDTADGFSAVWHLSGGCVDATVNEFSGVKQGSVGDTGGILGGAQKFHGNDFISINGLLDTPSTVTLSAWAFLDTPSLAGGEIISIGDAALIRLDESSKYKGALGSYFGYPGAPDSLTHEALSSGRFFKTMGWRHFTYVFDRAAMQHLLYIDGVLCCTKPVSMPIHYSGIGTKTIIGAHGNGKNYYNFNGIIDEVEVSHQKRSEAWIRLSYLSQIMPNLLLRIWK